MTHITTDSVILYWPYSEFLMLYTMSQLLPCYSLAALTTTPLIGLSILTIILLYIIRVTLHRRGMVPGPSRLPFLGNIFQLPSELQFIKFTEWAQKQTPNIVK